MRTPVLVTPTPRGEQVVRASERWCHPRGPGWACRRRRTSYAGAVSGHRPDEVRVETVVTDLQVPWSLAFAPDGRLFVTERPGRVRVVPVVCC